jgi:hypothetical protein
MTSFKNVEGRSTVKTRSRPSSLIATPVCPPFGESLTPLGLTLKSQPFIGGNQPLYADYAILRPFQWARCTSPFALVATDDPVGFRRDRLLNSFASALGAGYDAWAYLHSYTDEGSPHVPERAAR